MRTWTLMSCVVALGACDFFGDEGRDTASGAPDDTVGTTTVPTGADVAPVCFEVPDAMDNGCPAVESPIPFRMIGPNVQLVIDRSGSMQGDNWNALQSLVPLLPLVGSRANLGLSFFPSMGTGDSCSVQGGDVVPIREGNLAAVEIGDWLTSSVASPYGSTPMADALDLIASAPGLQCPNRDNVVVLLTDGEESCYGNVIRSVQRLVSQPEPIELYVIGFATTASQNATLLGIAAAAEATTGPDNFYTAENAEDLVARLAAVTSTCTAQLDAVVHEARLVVSLDGRALAPCTEDRCTEGYTYDAVHGNVTIEGNDCVSMLDGMCHDLQFDET